MITRRAWIRGAIAAGAMATAGGVVALNLPPRLAHTNVALMAAPRGAGATPAATGQEPAALRALAPAAAALRGLGKLALVQQGHLYVVDGGTGATAAIGDTGSAAAPAWSADGQWVAFLRLADPAVETGTLWIARSDGTELHEVQGLGGPVAFGGFAWSPKADVLAVTPQGAGGLWLVPTTGSPDPQDQASGVIGSLAWSPDGRQIAYSVTLPYTNPIGRSDALYTAGIVGSPSGLAPMDARWMGTRRYVAQDDGIIVSGWWPDSGGVLFWQDPQHSASLLADGAPLQSLAIGAGTPQTLLTMLARPRWLAPSATAGLAVVQGPGRDEGTNKSLAVCTLPAGKCQPLAQPSGTVSLDPAWSPDGSHLALVRGPESTADGLTLWVEDATGAAPRQITAAGAGVRNPQWSGDGTRLMYERAGQLWLVGLTGAQATPVATFQEPGAVPPAGTGTPSWTGGYAWYR